MNIEKRPLYLIDNEWSRRVFFEKVMVNKHLKERFHEISELNETF